jgi:hypothetical protein
VFCFSGCYAFGQPPSWKPEVVVGAVAAEEAVAVAAGILDRRPVDEPAVVTAQLLAPGVAPQLLAARHPAEYKTQYQAKHSTEHTSGHAPEHAAHAGTDARLHGHATAGRDSAEHAAWYAA